MKKLIIIKTARTLKLAVHIWEQTIHSNTILESTTIIKKVSILVEYSWPLHY